VNTGCFFFLFVAGRSEHRHCFFSALHRAGRLHRQVLCRLAPTWMPLGIIYCLLFIIWSTYLHTMIDQFWSWILSLLPLLCLYFSFSGLNYSLICLNFQQVQLVLM
jgi:hypothetical protein